MKYELVVVGALETNCYLAFCGETRDCAVIDPGADPGRIIAAVAALELRPRLILNTHGHLDHTGANADMKAKFDIPIWIHGADAPFLESPHFLELALMLGARTSPAPDRLLADGDDVTFGKCSLRVLHIPGHSPGSVGFLGNGLLFSGDTLFNGGVGRTDLPGGAWADLERSIRERILTLPVGTVVLPGHGPWTTVAQETESNPFLA